MSQKEAPRVGLLKALVAKRVTGREVATALAVTVRQVWRLKRRFEAGGAAGLLHRSRGRPSPRRLPAPLRQRVTTLLTTTYRDFNDCHATERLQEIEGAGARNLGCDSLGRVINAGGNISEIAHQWNRHPHLEKKKIYWIARLQR